MERASSETRVAFTSRETGGSARKRPVRTLLSDFFPFRRPPSSRAMSDSLAEKLCGWFFRLGHSRGRHWLHAAGCGSVNLTHRHFRAAARISSFSLGILPGSFARRVGKKLKIAGKTFFPFSLCELPPSDPVCNTPRTARRMHAAEKNRGGMSPLARFPGWFAREIVFL